MTLSSPNNKVTLTQVTKKDEWDFAFKLASDFFLFSPVLIPYLNKIPMERIHRSVKEAFIKYKCIVARIEILYYKNNKDLLMKVIFCPMSKEVERFLFPIDLVNICISL